MIPEINPNSYKMLSLESYTPLQRKTRHVKELQTVSDYKKVIKFEQLSVIIIMAKWCGPYSAIEKNVALFAIDRPNVSFGTIDIDKNKEAANLCFPIQQMPTFQLYRNSKKIDEIEGADFNELVDKV